MKIYSLAFLLLLQYPFASPITDSQQKLNKLGPVNIVFKSTDGGQTWQDISEGLPENWQGGDFFANDSGLYVSAGHRIYHNKPNSPAPFWEKEIFPDGHSSIAPGKNGIFAYNWDSQILLKINGTSVWSPVNRSYQVKDIRTVFETAGGTVFIGSNNGLFKSANRGKTWKLLLPSIEDKAFNLFVSGNVIYAIPRSGGC